MLQDASGELPHEQPAPQNADVQDAIHASLDLSQQAEPSSAQHTGISEGSAFADVGFQEAVSRALESGRAEPADSKAPQQVLSNAQTSIFSSLYAISAWQSYTQGCDT